MPKEIRKERAMESGPLERLFNGSSVAKILDFLAVFKEWDYSVSDIAKNSGVSFRTVLRELPKLEQVGLVKITRRVGRAKLYKLNVDVEVGLALEKFALKLAGIEAEKTASGEIKKEAIKARA
ncbi:MAG: winged helix-turn-helix domain-containing protein [Nitrososphaerales archaeon]